MSDETAEIDPIKHRQDWLKRLANEVDKIEPLMPIKLLPEGVEYPQWVLNVEREFSLAMLPSAKLKEPDFKITPKRMGAVLGHMCETAVWMMEWLVYQDENTDEVSGTLSRTEPPTEAQYKEGMEVVAGLVVWYGGMRRLAKLALCSCVDQSYEDMTDFLLGYADGFSRKPKTFRVGNLGNSTFEIHVFMLLYWRAVQGMDSVRQLYETLVNILGASRTGEQKRIEKICQRIGLHYRKPGRPKKLN
jgi:hypothetical protein